MSKSKSEGANDNEHIQKKACPSLYVRKSAAVERQTRTHAVCWFFLQGKAGKYKTLSNGKTPQSNIGLRGLIFYMTGFVEAGVLTSAAFPLPPSTKGAKGLSFSASFYLEGIILGKLPFFFQKRYGSIKIERNFRLLKSNYDSKFYYKRKSAKKSTAANFIATVLS